MIFTSKTKINLVALIGIEPISRVPETPILSIELQSLDLSKDNPFI